jgi:hypothetical protein
VLDDEVDDDSGHLAGANVEEVRAFRAPFARMSPTSTRLVLPRPLKQV